MEIPNGYVNILDLTERLGYSPKSRGAIRQMCQSGRIPGAYQMDNGTRKMWVAPWPCIAPPVHAVPDGYVNLTDLTERLGYSPKSRGVVWQLCQSGRISGAYQIDNGTRKMWVAPWPCIVHPVHAVPDGYVNLTDLTERLGYSPKSRGVVWQLCQSGRISGAYQIDNKMREWVAPWPCIVHPVHAVPDGYQYATEAALRLGLTGHEMVEKIYCQLVPGAVKAVHAGLCLFHARSTRRSKSYCRLQTCTHTRRRLASWPDCRNGPNTSWSCGTMVVRHWSPSENRWHYLGSGFSRLSMRPWPSSLSWRRVRNGLKKF